MKPYTNTMTVEIKPWGFELQNSNGAVIETAEQANKGALHRLLTKNGYKPSGKADQWVK